MARPKGSKNKKTELSVADQIAALEAEIEALQEQVAAKRAQIRSLRAAKKEEEKKRIFEAIEKSGKNAEEILALLEMD